MTWNINSVRLRLPLLECFLHQYQPDILCLQETKCPDDLFPHQFFHDLRYNHIALSGQKAYHGVAIISRIPLNHIGSISHFCGKDHCRYLSAGVTVGHKFLRIHNFYVPAGGDEPDPKINPKFAHKLDFLEKMKSITANQKDGYSSLLVGDLNIAPLETDVWSHKQLLKIVSHTPVETESLNMIRHIGGWSDLVRTSIPPQEKIFTWWSYRARDWSASNRGRRLDHIWGSPDLENNLSAITVLREARSWEKPSDHVPVIAHFMI